MDPKVSVIVPVYNTEQYLQQCIDSLIYQTYNNLEIILIDDGSLDKSAEICNQYAMCNCKVIVEHKENGGLTSARKAGLDIATGEYILFVDSDDWIDRNMVTDLVAVAKRDSADCVLCSHIKEFKTASKEYFLFGEKFCYNADDAENYVHRILIGPDEKSLSHPERINNLATTWGKLYSRESAQRGLLVNEREVGYAEDLLFNIYALDGCRCVSYVHGCFYHYRKYNLNSLTGGYRSGLADRWEQLYNYIDSYICTSQHTGYNQLFENRIACGVISLGINEVHAPGRLTNKIQAIRDILNRPRYVRALKSVNTHQCALHWRMFFCLCKHKQAILLTGMLMMIEMIRGQKNK